MTSTKKTNPPSKLLNGIDVHAYAERYELWSQMNPKGFRKLPSPKSSKVQPAWRLYFTDRVYNRIEAIKRFKG